MQSKEEQFILDQKEDIEEDAAKPRNKSKTPAYIGIILGGIGIFMPTGINVIFGVFAMIFGMSALHRGHNRLGYIANLLGFISVLALFLWTFLRF